MATKKISNIYKLIGPEGGLEATTGRAGLMNWPEHA